MPSVSALFPIVLLLMASLSEIYQAGLVALDGGRYSEARRLLAQVRQESTDAAASAEAAYLEITTLRLMHEQFRFEQEAEAFIAAHGDAPEAIALEYDLIRQKSTLGYYSDAVKLYEHFLSEHPDCPQARAAQLDLRWLRNHHSGASEETLLSALSEEISEDELLATHCEILRKAFHRGEFARYMGLHLRTQQQFGDYLTTLPETRSYTATPDVLSVLPRSEFAYMLAVAAGDGLSFRDRISLLDQFLAEYPSSQEASQAEIVKAEILYKDSDFPAFIDQVSHLQDLMPDSPQMKLNAILKWEREQREASAADSAWGTRLNGLKNEASSDTLSTLLASFWEGCLLYDNSLLEEANDALTRVIAYEGNVAELPAVADMREEAEYLLLDMLAKEGRHEEFLTESVRYRQKYPNSIRMGEVRFAEACVGLECGDIGVTLDAVSEMRAMAGRFENNALIDALEGLAKHRQSAELASAVDDPASTSSLAAETLEGEARTLLVNYLSAIDPPPSTINNSIDANLGFVRIEALFELGNTSQMLAELAAYSQDYVYRDPTPLAQAYLFAGIAMARMDLPDHSKALEFYDKALALEFPEPNASNHLRTKALAWAVRSCTQSGDAEKKQSYLNQLQAMPDSALKHDLLEQDAM